MRLRPDVLCGAATLAVNNALRFAPVAMDAELAPHVGPAAFQQVDPVRIRWERQFECVVQEVAIPMPIDQTFKDIFHPNALSAARIGVRQVKKYVAVGHLSRTTRKALAHPYCGQPSRDALTLEPLVEALTYFRKQPAIGIISRLRADPKRRPSLSGWFETTVRTLS